MTAYAVAEDLGGSVGYLKNVDITDPTILELVENILDRATSIVDGFLQFSFSGFTSGTAVKVKAGYGAYMPIPPHDYGSVTAVLDGSGGDLVGLWEELASGTLYAVTDNGYEGNWNGGRYTITADWGYGNVPDDVIEVTLELAVNIWRSKDSGRFTNVIGASDGGAVGYEGALTPQQKMVLTNVKRKYFKTVL
jgi:hypothetical protein